MQYLFCDQLQKDFSFTDYEINNISMGVWKGIESEKIVSDLKINELQAKLDKAVEALKYFDQVLRIKKTFKFEELEYKAFIELKELGVE